MLNQAVLQDVIANYKQDLDVFQWKNERYKWRAVRHFQDFWDIEAENFAEMLEQALGYTENLLASVHYFPLEMIKYFAKAAPEEVRAAFRSLYGEGRDIADRVAQFKSQADLFLEKYGEGANNHFQNENSISTYLWLRYPDKYYIYKYGETRIAAKVLVSDYSFKKGAYTANIRNAFAFYDELSMELRKDEELIEMLRSHMTDEEYPDEQYRTLAIDVGFYISRWYSDKVKTTYLTEIIESLKALGGKAHLSEIHAMMEKRDKLQSIHTNPTWKQTVSATLQSHSSDTKSYNEKNKDLFFSVEGLGVGIWGLRNYIPDEWSPDDYTPGLSVKDWMKLLKDPSVFNRNDLKIMKRMLDIGSEASAEQLDEKYGGNSNYLYGLQDKLGKRIWEKSKCDIRRFGNDVHWSDIIFLTKFAYIESELVIIYKLRDELKEALKNFDLSNVPLYEGEIEPIDPPEGEEPKAYSRE